MAWCLGEAHRVRKLLERERLALGDPNRPAGDELDRLRQRGVDLILRVVVNQR